MARSRRKKRKNKSRRGHLPNPSEGNRDPLVRNSLQLLTDPAINLASSAHMVKSTSFAIDLLFSGLARSYAERTVELHEITAQLEGKLVKDFDRLAADDQRKLYEALRKSQMHKESFLRQMQDREIQQELVLRLDEQHRITKPPPDLDEKTLELLDDEFSAINESEDDAEEFDFDFSYEEDEEDEI